jgi:hypothetical protein
LSQGRVPLSPNQKCEKLWTLPKIADGDQWTMPATIDDPAILEGIGGAPKGHGVGR